MKACITPPIPNSRTQSTMLIMRSFPAPFLRKTATGGRNIARIMSRMLIAKVLIECCLYSVKGYAAQESV